VFPFDFEAGEICFVAGHGKKHLSRHRAAGAPIVAAVSIFVAPVQEPQRRFR
jgi:hypothetical protein